MEEDIEDQNPSALGDNCMWKTIRQFIGTKWKHHKGNIYTIIGPTWVGDQDEWGVQHTREGSDVVFTRTYSNFFGSVPDLEICDFVARF